jgi:Bacterial Ig domain
MRSGKKNFSLGLIGAALFILASTAGAQATCGVLGYFLFTSEGPWNQAMQVDAGKRCSSLFASGGASVFKRLYMVSQAKHGTVSISEGGHYSYNPKPGFKGSDTFMLRVCGSTSGVEGCANLKYDVTVQ